jgi:hypothetical protein
MAYTMCQEICFHVGIGVEVYAWVLSIFGVWDSLIGFLAAGALSLAFHCTEAPAVAAKQRLFCKNSG